MYDKNDLRWEAQYRRAFERVRRGLVALAHNPVRLAASLLYWIMVVCLLRYYSLLLDLSPLGAKLMQPVMYILFPPVALALYLLVVAVCEMPRNARQLSDAMMRAGVINKVGEPPMVLADTGNSITLKIEGIPPELLTDRRTAIETAINRRVVRIVDGADKQQIVLRTAPGDAKFPDKITLHRADLPAGANTIALGMALDGPVCIDLSVTPHLLVGGCTGSGKTCLVQSIIWQALEKRMDVYILDLKGGVDYPRQWKDTDCNYSDSRESVLSILSYLTDELENRKFMFDGAEKSLGVPCPDLDTFNHLRPDNVRPRILIACDEIAELTDTTGLDKANKDLIAAIVAKFSVLARQGRAFGLHLLLATQRPDANVLPGQIKNNMDIRACGRADLVLSQIILDNGDAAGISKDARGRFLTNIDGGIEMQGYYLDIAHIFAPPGA